jgi:heptaprenylglycerol acetyltransferase
MNFYFGALKNSLEQKSNKNRKLLSKNKNRSENNNRIMGKVKQLLNRIYHIMARLLPGAYWLRPMLHRWRGVKLGKDVFIGADCYLDDLCPDQITIEEKAEVNAKCIVLAHDGYKIRSVKIGHHAAIGVGSVILPGIEIGPHAIVGANSTVSRDIPPGCIAFGSPAKVFRFIKDTPEMKIWRKNKREWLQYTEAEKKLMVPKYWE